MMRKIIIDSDPGIDDAIALMVAFEHPDIEILGITTVAGNKGIELTTENACKISTLYGADVSVFKGANADYHSLISNSFRETEYAGDTHGKDGLGSVELPFSRSLISKTSAVDFIIDKVRKYPGEIDIIALGPLTNIALAINKDLETMKKVKSVYSMGGGLFQGNITQFAEFNYWTDAEAANIVYSKLGRYVPVYMIGLDVTHQVVIDAIDLEFMRLVGGKKGQLVYDMTRDYVNSYWKFNGIVGIYAHDVMTMIAYIDPSLFSEILHTQIRVLVDDSLRIGQTYVVSESKLSYKNAYISMKVSCEEFKERFLQLLLGDEVRKKYLEYKNKDYGF